MKEKKNHVGLILALAFILIVVGIILYLVLTYQDNQNEVKKRMETVTSLYTDFKEHVDAFNDKRNEVYQTVMQDMYYQTLQEKDAEFKALYTSYEETIDVINDDYDQLRDKCINVLYPDVSVNNKCEAIVAGYEEVVNTYISDVNSYNALIDSYNEWLNDNNSSSDTKLEKIKLDRDYLDINGDREYNGRKDTETEISDENNTGAEPSE